MKILDTIEKLVRKLRKKKFTIKINQKGDKWEITTNGESILADSLQFVATFLIGLNKGYEITSQLKRKELN